MRHDFRSHLLDRCAILGIWAVAIACIWPRGNFPLNDDWDFAVTTWNFARTGEFHFTNFTAVSLRALVVWGATWTRLFGESFEVLRASTLVLAAILICVIHLILVEAGVPRPLRFFATLAFAFHPIFIWASCTYMTEVPYVLASAVAFYFMYRALKLERLDLLLLGCAAVVVSWFVRQTGITNLFAPLALVLFFRKSLTARWRQFAAILAAFVLLFAFLLIFKRDWLAGSPDEFANHFRMWTEVTFRLPQQIAVIDHYFVFTAQNAALFFLPLSIGLLFAEWRQRSDWVMVLLVACSAIILFRAHELVRSGHPMPYFAKPFCCDIMNGNVFVNLGLGQQTLSDVWGYGKPYTFALTEPTRAALTYGSAILACLLVWRMIVMLIRDRRVFALLAIGTAAAGTVALFGSGAYFDRYAFDAAWSVGLVLPLLVPWERRFVRAIAIAMLIAVISFDILALQEYFAWNRARWSAYDDLRQRGIPTEQIDAGSEPLSLFKMVHLNQLQRRRLIMASKPRPYVLAFQPLDGFVIEKTFRFNGWLGYHRGAIYVLRRQPAPAV